MLDHVAQEEEKKVDMEEEVKEEIGLKQPQPKV